MITLEIDLDTADDLTIQVLQEIKKDCLSSIDALENAGSLLEWQQEDLDSASEVVNAVDVLLGYLICF